MVVQDANRFRRGAWPEAVHWILNTGAQWHMLPQSYPNHKTIHWRFQTWRRDEVLRRVLTGVSNELRDKGVLDEEERFINATFAMAKGGGAEISPTKPGKGMKIMAIVDRHGLPLSVTIRAANHRVVYVLFMLYLCFFMRYLGFNIRRLQTRMNDMSSTKHCAPFFIVGSSRSGTTLLRLIVAGHSRIVIPPETWFILDLVDQFPLTSPLTPEQVRAAIRVVTEAPRWPDMNMSAKDFANRAVALDRPTLADLINIVFRFHLKQSGKSRIGDKTPGYINIVPQLKTIYPGAKFIHLIRDGHNVAISLVENHYKGRPYHGDAFEWTKAVRSGMSYRSSPFAHNILEVRYEDLVGQPERTVHAICEFLGETFEPSMMAFGTRLDLVPKRERDIHQKLSKPNSADAIEVWRSKLSALECFVIEASLRKDLEVLGYPLRFSAPVWRPFLYVTRQLTQALAPLLDYVVPALRRRGIMSRHGYV